MHCLSHICEVGKDGADYPGPFSNLTVPLMCCKHVCHLCLDA